MNDLIARLRPFAAVIALASCVRPEAAVVQDDLAAAAALPKVEVRTPLGPLIGRTVAHGEVFLGVPYALAPVGAKRWQPPQPVPPWSTPRDAGKAAARCPQVADPIAAARGGDQAKALTGAEDCLYLNIHRPAGGQSDARPVMVWIHGGAYKQGAGSTYDAGLFAERQGVVVVTINYRLGALGFLTHPALNTGDVLAANYGHQDQLLALNWVKQNISSFGGDPGKVTVFGESAGGTSVCTLLATPSAAGLFHRAIVQSGSCRSQPQGEALEQGQALAKALHCPEGEATAACLRAMSAEALVTAGEDFGWGPVVGDRVLPETPQAALSSGHWLKVPTMIGTTHDEARLFALLQSYTQPKMTEKGFHQRLIRSYGDGRAPAIIQAYPVAAYPSARLAAAAVSTDSGTACSSYKLATLLSPNAPVYSYEFNDPHTINSLEKTPDVPDLGAFHAGELTYLFQHKWLIADPAQFSPEQQVLANTMASYWGNFAKQGDPNGPSLPTWDKDLPVDRHMQSLAPEAVQPVADFAKDHHCDLWR